MAVLALWLAREFGLGSRARPNVILISIDTLRADHLGAYGYGPPTSPNLDAFAADSIVFETSIASAPSTLASHASIMTSLAPSKHGALFSRHQPLPDERRTLAEVLDAAGYRTMAIHGGGQLDKDWNLYQGFDDRDEVHHPGPFFASTVREAASWLSGWHWGDPWFLFLHSYQIHHPYKPTEEDLAFFDAGYSGLLPDHIEVDDHLREMNRRDEGALAWDDADLAHVIATYDGEIRSMDAAFGELIETLHRLDLYEDTLIIFTSDHGEEFGEHGWVGWHSHTLYDELLRVPLIMKLPGERDAGRRVSGVARGVDIAPTVVAAAGLPPVESFEGRDLLDEAAGEEPPAISQRDLARPTFLTSVRTARWKLVGDALFDLAADPGELTDVAAQQPAVVRRLRGFLPEDATAGPRIIPSEGLQEQLRALGYVDEPAP